MLETKLETVSRICIKPSSPTPPHLKSFRVCLLDQLSPDLHANMTFFYPYKPTINNDMDPTLEFAIKSRLLQQSLSQTLTHFYPLAGRFKNDSIVDCNDNGVIFIESRTNSHLSDFLSHPDFTVIDSHFLPSSDPQTMEMSKGSMLLFRFILFGCGGTAISCCSSHKIMDLTSFVILLRSWSSTSCGTTVPVFPDLNIATSRLPSINEMSQMPASVVLSNKKLASRRFVFDTFKIRELKSKVISAFEDKQEFNYNPSRVEVVAAFLWKCALKAFISRKGTFRPSIFIQAVNLRPRMDPPLPQNAMGNLAWLFPLVVIENEKDLEFVELVKKLMATRLSLKNKVKEFKGAGIVEALKESLKEREELLSNKMDYAVYICASWCRCPLFETDFGWGKPAWITSVVNHLMTNTIHLLDTKDVDGVEALVHLDEEEMNIFENIEDLLKFTSTNPSVSVI